MWEQQHLESTRDERLSSGTAAEARPKFITCLRHYDMYRILTECHSSSQDIIDQ